MVLATRGGRKQGRKGSSPATYIEEEWGGRWSFLYAMEEKWSRMGALGSYRAGAREGLEEGGGASLPCVALNHGRRLGYVPAALSE
jgi:hypothetical protein